jgi:hypothetical protein
MYTAKAILIEKEEYFFNKLYWVLKARSLNELYLLQNPAMECLLVDEDEWVCSDGHRMHIANRYMPRKGNRFLPEGLLRPLLVTKQRIILQYPPTEWKYPNYKQVIPSVEGRIGYQLIRKTNPVSGLFSQVVKALKPSYGLDYKFFKGVILGSGEEWNFFAPENVTNPVVLESESKDKLALVMPIDMP